MGGGDEIAQVCTLEIEGVKFVFNASVQAASWVMQALTALYGLHSQASEKRSEKCEKRAEEKLEAPGEMKRSDLLKLSAKQGGLPQILKISDETYNRVIELFVKNGIRWAPMVDFDPFDKKKPVEVCPQDLPLATVIINDMTKKKTIEDESVCGKYGQQIAEIKEKLLGAGPDERKELETVLEDYMRARNEKMHIIDSQKESLEKGPAISFNEYLEQSKGTAFEADPIQAMKDLDEKGIEIAPAYAAKECLQPVRDPELMPESEMQFILPESGIAITRDFEVDKDTGLVFSNYSFKTDSGEMYEYSDHNTTAKAWNDSILPALMDKAKITENMQCRVFAQQEYFEAYLKIYDSPNGERKAEASEETPVFHDADVKREAEHAVSEELKASAPLEVNTVSFEVPEDALYMEYGKIKYKDGDTEYEFSGVRPGDVKDGTISFSISKDAKVKVVQRNANEDSSQEKIISAREAKGLISGAGQGQPQIRAVSR